MTSFSGKEKSNSTLERPETTPKGTGWQQGLDNRDLDILRQRTSVVVCQGSSVAKPAKMPSEKKGEKEKEDPRPIEVSPVEFARLAALLAQQYGKQTPPQRYFLAADELIRLADHYLNHDRAEVQGKRVAKLEKDLNKGWVAIDVALGTLNKKPGEKKGTSQLGNLSTRGGLIKALHRLYGDGYTDQIERRTFRIKGKKVEADAIHQTTIDRILEDQRQANERRGQRKTDASKAQ